MRAYTAREANSLPYSGWAFIFLCGNDTWLYPGVPDIMPALFACCPPRLGHQLCSTIMYTKIRQMAAQSISRAKDRFPVIRAVVFCRVSRLR